jgi:hypothetical protein
MRIRDSGSCQPWIRDKHPGSVRWVLNSEGVKITLDRVDLKKNTFVRIYKI